MLCNKQGLRKCKEQEEKQNIEELLIKLALSILCTEWDRNPVGKVSGDPVIKICNIMHKQNEADLKLHGQH